MGNAEDTSSARPPAGPKYEFCSPGWLAAYHGAMAACVAIAAVDTPDLSFSICELASDPPVHLSPDGQPCGFHCFVRDGVLERFGAGDAAGVERKIVIDYAVMIDICRFEIGRSRERAVAYREMTKAAYEAGQLHFEGEQPRLPAPFHRLHDAIARITA
jgi:hypothetical protein